MISFHGDHVHSDLVHKRDTAATNEYVKPSDTSYARAYGVPRCKTNRFKNSFVPYGLYKWTSLFSNEHYWL